MRTGNGHPLASSVAGLCEAGLRLLRSIIPSLVLGVTLLGGATVGAIDFAKEVRPIFEARCFECHGPEKQKSSFRLDLRETAMKGGSEGLAIVPGKSGESALIDHITAPVDDEMRMPPKGGLTEAQIADLSNWVRMGLPDPRVSTAKPVVTADVEKARSFWSLRPVAEPIAPPVKDPNWPRTAIDRFALARMESHGLSPVADADRRTLLRRATFDLIGLPPTPEESAAFLADQSPAAFAAVVDRLLASPHYGERWGRHWLVPRPD